MKGNPDVIKVLNEVLRKELTGVNQYFIHAKMCRNWGYEVLANVHWKESIDEMKHADQIIERILFFEGVPNVQAYDKIQLGSTHGFLQKLHSWCLETGDCFQCAVFSRKRPRCSARPLV